jgi:hypothetical protein
MKKYFITAMVFLTTTTAVFAQKKQKSPPNKPAASDSAALVNKALQSAAANTTEAPKPKKVWDLSKRAADHFMFELGYDNWAGKPDSVNIKGFNHSVNFYVMLDFPFKTDQRMSIGVGLGIGSSNIYFDQTYPQVAAYQNSTLAFTPTNGGDHYKRFKLTNVYLEVPVELRYALDPEHMDKSWKFAVGTKVGLMLSAYTKAVTPVNSFGNTLGNVTLKASSKQFFSAPKFTPTLRVSKGVIGVFGQFQVNSLLKAGAGPTIFPWAAGIVLSGL